MTQPNEPEPTPPHITYPSGPPGGDSLAPYPMYPEGNVGPDGTWQTPQYPPYIPEQQFDTSGGAPRSTLDGIHGTGADEPERWAPSYPGELPPYWTKDYVQDKTDPNLWWPDHRPDAPGSTHPAAYHGDKDGKHDPAAQGAGKLDVNPADLHNAADEYAQLQAAAAAIGPQAVDEVNRIIATHGAMGYPVAVGVVAGLARRQAQLDRKAADFGRYAERFTEHAAEYQAGDREGAHMYQTVSFSQSVEGAGPMPVNPNPNPYNLPYAEPGPNVGPAIPPSVINPR
ncbi:type VII secretion target [Mycobacterium avium subsp. hominissuis]|uniref:type VII secretion target n=1 Tax=Mycobacterium avium TaxID=1764 RepID=UPI002666E0F9|nr:type VII secretion target [Mycobacterium avium]MDO2394822.1 type VII secretion target [Mycobacterium avium subsp. hominissuis]